VFEIAAVNTVHMSTTVCYSGITKASALIILYNESTTNLRLANEVNAERS